MKRILMILCLIILPGIVHAQPAIEFDSESHDFGKVSSSTTEHVFEFLNNGDQELVIQKVHASWGCTAVVASSSRLKPGEKGQITAELNLAGRKGLVRKNIRVFSNDPKRTVVNLTLSATVE